MGPWAQWAWCGLVGKGLDQYLLFQKMWEARYHLIKAGHILIGNEAGPAEYNRKIQEKQKTKGKLPIL